MDHHTVDPTTPPGHHRTAGTVPVERLDRNVHLDVDLDAVERDLADVETALIRLDAGTYWTDEVTGAPIPDDLLAEHPLVRRAP
jgi:RNA polymerase-binding transcription factor DksA